MTTKSIMVVNFHVFWVCISITFSYSIAYLYLSRHGTPMVPVSNYNVISQRTQLDFMTWIVQGILELQPQVKQVQREQLQLSLQTLKFIQIIRFKAYMLLNTGFFPLYLLKLYNMLTVHLLFFSLCTKYFEIGYDGRMQFVPEWFLSVLFWIRSRKHMLEM